MCTAGCTFPLEFGEVCEFDLAESSNFPCPTTHKEKDKQKHRPTPRRTPRRTADCNALRSYFSQIKFTYLGHTHSHVAALEQRAALAERKLARREAEALRVELQLLREKDALLDAVQQL